MYTSGKARNKNFVRQYIDIILFDCIFYHLSGVRKSSYLFRQKNDLISSSGEIYQIIFYEFEQRSSPFSKILRNMSPLWFSKRTIVNEIFVHFPFLKHAWTVNYQITEWIFAVWNEVGYISVRGKRVTNCFLASPITFLGNFLLPGRRARQTLLFERSLRATFSRFENEKRKKEEKTEVGPRIGLSRVSRLKIPRRDFTFKCSSGTANRKQRDSAELSRERGREREREREREQESQSRGGIPLKLIRYQAGRAKFERRSIIL